MNITLQRNELREAVQGFGKVITGKSTLPVLGCVRFDAGRNEVTAHATDLDQTVDYRFDGAKVLASGSCIVPLATLKDLAKGNKSENVEIRAESPLHLALINNVAGHAVRQVIDSMELDEWPSLQSAIDTKPAPGFIGTYQRLVGFSSTDETRHIITGVYVEIGEGETPVTMTATDGRRLVSQNSMSLPLSQSIIVPTSKFLSWSKLPDDTEIGVRDDKSQVWLGVRVGRFNYTVKTIDGTYPNYRQVIPATPGEHTVTFTDGDVELLKAVLPTTFPGDEEITVVGHRGKVTVYGRGSGNEQWTRLTLEDTGYEGERSFIAVNRHYLLAAFKAGFRAFSITDALSPVLSRDSRGALHVLMPMRTDDPEDTCETQPQVAGDVVQPEDNSETKSADEPATDSPADKPTATRREKTKVTKQNEHKTDTPALDRVLAACDAAKTKVKEAGQALTELSAAIKEATRQQKTQAKEVESARTALAKLQAISL